jgi:hypothetical protein
MLSITTAGNNPLNGLIFPSIEAQRTALKLRPAAATDKTDLFLQVWPPLADSFKRSSESAVVNRQTSPKDRWTAFTCTLPNQASSPLIAKRGPKPASRASADAAVQEQ